MREQIKQALKESDIHRTWLFPQAKEWLVYLIGEVERLKEVEENFKALTDIMDRARRLAYLASEEEEEDRPRFRMDTNGNLTRIEDGE